MSADNKAVFRRLIREVWNKGNLNIAGEIVATNHVSHDPAIAHEDGLGGFKNHVTRVRTAFPDIEFKIEDILEDGEKVITRWTASGTHRGAFLGVPAAGKQFTVTGITVLRFARGKIVEDWVNWDALGLMQQLGAVPASGQAKAATAGWRQFQGI